MMVLIKLRSVEIKNENAEVGINKAVCIDVDYGTTCSSIAYYMRDLQDKNPRAFAGDICSIKN